MNDFERLFESHATEDTRQFEIARDERKEMRHMITDLKQSIELAHEAEKLAREALGEKFEKLDELLEPLTEAYSGIIFSKKILTGTAAVILAFAAIGGGIIWVVNAAIHR